MKTRRTIALLLISVLLCACFAGCGGGASYKDNVPVKDIALKISEAKTDVDFAEMTEGYVQNAMQLDTSLFSEYSVLVSSGGANIDQFGVFKAAENVSADTLKKALEDYLSFCREKWMDEYLPEQKPKLEAAQVKICGNYGIYTIFAEADMNAAFKTFEEMLK